MMDKKHGHGVYKWADGRVYDGQWANGVQNGYGYYQHSQDKDRKIGYWEKGKRKQWVTEKETDQVADEIKNSLHESRRLLNEAKE